jgi:hypothetical protein
MRKKIFIGVAGLAGLVGLLAIVVMLQPSTYRIERSIEVEAPRAAVWAEVRDFHKWSAWNAWEKVDPTQVTTVTGQPGTVGHKSSWVGQESGSGSMTMVELREPDRAIIELEFIEPFPSRAMTGVELVAAGERSNVTWWMTGENSFLGKAFSLVMDMDEMIGSKYAESLADLKAIAEKDAARAAETVATADTAGN